jgi:hypothetical protein
MFDCRQMEEDGVKPDGHTIVALLTGAARCVQSTAADIDAILSYSNSTGVKLSSFLCAALIQAYRSCSEMNPDERARLGEAVIARMHVEGIPVNAVVVNSMIALYWDGMAYDKARAQYDQMVEMGVMPTSRTCKMMEHLCIESGNLDDAQSFRELKESLQLLDPSREQ